VTPLLTITGVGLWAAAVAAGLVIRRRLVAGQPVDQARLRRLGPFDVAFVTGGPDRVKITVLASLVDEGVLRVVGNRFDLVADDRTTEPTASAATLRARALDDVRAGRQARWTTEFVLDDLSDDLRSLLDVPPAALALARPLALRWLPLIGLCTFWLAIEPGLVLAVLMGLAILSLVGMVALDLGHQPMLQTRRRLVATNLQEAGGAGPRAPIPDFVARYGSDALPRGARRAYQWQIDSGSG